MASSFITSILEANHNASHPLLWQMPTTTTSTTMDAARTTRGRTRRRRKAKLLSPTDNTDGSFNGGPLFLRHTTLRHMESHAHCIGDTMMQNNNNNADDDTAWQYKSCRFSLMCFNTTARDFVLFASPLEQGLAKHYEKLEHWHVSDVMHTVVVASSSSNKNTTSSHPKNGVSLGGINQKWGHRGIPRLKWFPKVIEWTAAQAERPVVYYELPSSTILIPYHSLNGANPGHLVWDDFLPMYNLLSMFQLLDDDDNGSQHELLPLRYRLQDGERGLWASCDLREEKTKMCTHMITKFWSLLVGNDTRFHYSDTFTTDFQEKTPGTSNLVCAKTGLAGIGPLTDHGVHKAHGWETSDYKYLHNYGRGGLLYDFRNYMLENIEVDPYQALEKPYRIVFSQGSSDIHNRRMDFVHQMSIVKEQMPNVVVENYTLKDLSIHEQMEIAARTSVFVTMCGGGAVTAMFLPRGASVLIYYAEDGGTSNGKRNYKPAMLDWDLFNSLSHLRVHWLPRNTRLKHDDDQALVWMIENELRLIEKGIFK